MSSFQLTQDQTMIQELAADLAQKKVKVFASEVDAQVRYPAESMFAITEAGLNAAAIPQEFGGAGLDSLSQVLIVEETAKACGSTAAILASGSVGTECILRFGTPEQKSILLPKLAEGATATVAIFEGPNDITATAIHTRAEAADGGYVLNGTKCHVPNVGNSNYYIVICTTAETELTAFVVDKDASGLKIGRRDPKMGLQAWYTGEVILENCIVKADSILGGIGKGTDIIKAAQNFDRFYMGAVSTGIALGALKEAIEYVNVRVQFGKRIAQFQNTQYVMAEHMARVRAAEVLLWKAAANKDENEAAMAKLICADSANLAVRKCVQAMSGFGYTREYPVERMMRDAKMTEVFGGSAELQKDFIAQNIGVY